MCPLAENRNLVRDRMMRTGCLVVLKPLDQGELWIISRESWTASLKRGTMRLVISFDSMWLHPEPHWGLFILGMTLWNESRQRKVSANFRFHHERFLGYPESVIPPKLTLMSICLCQKFSQTPELPPVTTSSKY